MTLIELLIGLAITAVTCGVLAVLINATAMGTNSQADGRRSLTRTQTIKATLQDEFVNARAILATGSNYVVYWIGDQSGAATPVNGAVNFSELRLLALDQSGNLNIYFTQWPANFSSSNIVSNDTVYASSTDWYGTATALKGTSYYTSTTVATGVTALAVSLDNATATSAHYVHVKIDLYDGSVSRQVVLGVNLANPSAPW